LLVLNSSGVQLIKLLDLGTTEIQKIGRLRNLYPKTSLLLPSQIKMDTVTKSLKVVKKNRVVSVKVSLMITGTYSARAIMERNLDLTKIMGDTFLVF